MFLNTTWKSLIKANRSRNITQNVTIIDRSIADIEEPYGEYTGDNNSEFIIAEQFPVFGEHNIEFSLRRKLPERAYTYVKNALVHGQCAALMTRKSAKYAVHWAIGDDVKLEFSPGDYSRYFDLKKNGWNLASNPTLETSYHIDKAILLGSRHSYNYFHFMTDTITRLIIAEERSDNPKIPYLMCRVGNNMHDLLSHVAPNRAILYSSPNDLIEIGTLSVPIPATYSPDDASKASEATFDATYVPRVRDRIKSSFPPSKSCFRNVFIVRPSYRNISNMEAIDNVLADHNFLKISPERLTIAEQIATFSNARLIIGVGGAAFTNMIFCDAGATIISLSQKQSVRPDYWALMAHMLDHRFAMVACEPVYGTSPYPTNLDVTVDPLLLTNAIDWALST